MTGRTFRVAAVVLLLFGLIVAVSPTPATAAVSGIDPTLCKSTTSRLSVPTGYPLDVCFTGSAVTIKNNTVYVLHISATGVIGTPTRSGLGGDPAGLVVAHSDPSPYELPPGFSVTVPVGNGAASFTQAGSPNETEYARLRLLSTYIPGHTYAEFSAADDFVNSLSADSSTYAQCQEHANLFKQAACAAALSWDVGEAIAVLGVSIGAELGSRIIGSIINLISSVGWVSVGVNQFLTVLHSPKTFTIASVIPSAPSAQPTLGVNWPTNGGGFGQVEPSLVSNGGDATSVVTGITWQSWGGPEATGKGLSAYLPPGAASAAEEFQEPVTIVAFNLDNCAGVPAYTSVEWYFPEYGQSFNPSQGESICTNPFGTPTSVPTTTTSVPAASSCPTPAQVYAAWVASPGIEASAPGSVTGFSHIQCWENWVVATVVGNGNGVFFFSQTGGLHGLSASESSDFMSAVCSDPSAPAAWKGPNVAECPS